MKKFVKKLAVVAVVLAVVVGGGLYALATFAPMDYIQEKARTAVKEQTGRDLAMGGAKVIIWPHIGVTLKDVSMSNPDWASDKNMVRVGELDVHVALRPLLQKRLEVVRFVMNQPEISLEVSPRGERSWDFKPAKKKESQSADKKDAAGGSAGDMMTAFRLDKFEINKGRLLLDDREKGSKTLLENVNIAVSFPDIDSTFQLDGSMEYLGKRVQLVMSVEKPKAFIEGKTTPGSFVINTDVVKANVSGTFGSSGTYVRADNMTAEVSSLSGLVAWLTQKPAEKLPFEKISFSAQADVTGQSLQLRGANLKLDEVEAKGTARLNYGGKKPEVYARLDINKIDLDRFMGDANAAASGGAKSAAAEGQTDWDATPIDFSGLRAVDADVILQTQGFSLRGVEVGPSRLKAMLQNGALEASSSDATLFGGTFGANVMLAAPETGAVQQSFSFKMKDVQAQPVLEKFADFKKLSGAADANVTVASKGNSQKEIVSNLAGNGSVTFKNGSLSGIDFVNIAQMIQRGLQDAGVGEGKTEFVDLGGTFTIASGIVTNNDFRMRGPLVQAGGSGTVDLPRKYLKYRVTPVLTASSGAENAKGVGVPVDIVGPFSNIRVRPDFKTVIQNAVTNPEAIKEQGKALEENFKNIKKDIKKDPGAAIQNLLGGGGLFGQPAPQPSPQPAPAEGGAAP